MMFALLSSAALFVSFWTSAESTCDSDIRVRRPWHSLSDEEQMQFVTGFQALRTEALLVEFMKAHEKATSSDDYDIHDTPENFYWHSYWLYELESSIRGLGPEYECFALPYWDVTHDGEIWNGMPEADVDKDINNLPIYKSNMGAEGRLGDYCVGAPWSPETYSTDDLCTDDELPGNCCLKRAHTAGNDMPTRQEVVDVVYLDEDYAEYLAFQIGINEMHSDVHNFIGSEEGTHFNTVVGAQAEDPLFPLFHSFIEYLRLMHTDCSQMDVVPNDQLDDYLPYSFDNAYQDDDGNYVITLDFVMDFSALCDGGNGQSKRVCSGTDITPRLMYDVSPNTQWNVKYAVGEFWNANHALQSACLENLNTTWWVLDEANLIGQNTESLKYIFGINYVADMSIHTWTVVAIVMAMVAVAGWRLCCIRNVKVLTESGNYAAI